MKAEIIEQPHCMINGCHHPLDGILKTEACMKRIGEKLEVICNNGVGFKHVVTMSGRHYGVSRKRD